MQTKVVGCVAQAMIAAMFLSGTFCIVIGIAALTGAI